MEVKSDKEPVNNRAYRREQMLAAEKLQGLLKQYVDFKNKNIVEEKGEIRLKVEVMMCFDELNQEWKKFCYGFKTNTQRHYKFDVHLFRDEVEKHLRTHRELCWVNYVRRITGLDAGDTIALEHRMARHCSPTIINIRAKYEPDADPFAAALEIREEIIYFMKNMLEIPDAGIKLEYASNVSELSREDYLFYIDLVLQLRMNMIDLDEFKTRLILQLIHAKSSIQYEKLLKMAVKSDKSKAVVDHIHANIHLLVKSLDGFFEEKEVEIEPQPLKKGAITEQDADTGNAIPREHVMQIYPVVNFTKQLLPWIKVPFMKYFKRKLYGPDDLMGNSTFYELRAAHGYFTRYANHNEDTMALSKLIATLYRPKKSFLFFRKLLPGYNGDIRRKISEKTNALYLENRAKKINKLHIKYQFGAFQFFRNIEEFIRYGKINIGENEIELKVLYEGDPDFVSTGPDIGMASILFNIAEAGTLGPIDKVDDSNMYDVLVLLYKSVKEANDRKATMERYQKIYK